MHFTILRLFTTVFILATSMAGYAREKEESELAARLQKRIDAYHKGEEPNGETLRLVYFHPGDTEPQEHYRERIRRIAFDFRDYYYAEMKRVGFSVGELPLEMKDGDLVIHLVKGSGKSGDYTYEKGGRVKREMQEALDGVIDFESDFVLVLGGMCQKRGENDYFFHAPYYGAPGSNQVWGLCYAADCEILDPDNLSAANAKVKMKFEEHYGDYNMTVARFNSWYLGGIAHELGHGLSLPHNGQLPIQKLARGNALMGGGNHTYGEERWGEGKGSFMTLASCLRLAVHPLFTGSDRERFAEVTHAFDELNYEADGKKLVINGKVSGLPEPLAVIAYSDPPERDGYNALTWVGEVGADGKFSVVAEDHKPGIHDLRLTVVHLNGATNTLNSRYLVRSDGTPQAGAINATQIVEPAAAEFLNGDPQKGAALAKELLSADPPREAARRLKHLVALADPPEPVDLKADKPDHVSLSDVKWESAEVGWGEPARNQYYIGPNVRNAVFLELAGVFFEKGLYAHAPSEYVFDLGGTWSRFTATVGLQAGVGSLGRSRFIVKGDGKVLFTSKLLKGIETENVSVAIHGVNELRLIVESGIQGNPQCWSIWGAPRIVR